MGHVKSSMWDVTEFMWTVAASMLAVASSTPDGTASVCDVKDSHGLSHPMCGMF